MVKFLLVQSLSRAQNDFFQKSPHTLNRSVSVVDGLIATTYIRYLYSNLVLLNSTLSESVQ